MTIRFEYWLHYDYDADDNEFRAAEKLEKGSLTLEELKYACFQIIFGKGFTSQEEGPQYAVEVLARSDDMFYGPMVVHWDCRGCDVKRELYQGEGL